MEKSERAVEKSNQDEDYYDEPGSDDLMGTIGINLEETAEVACQPIEDSLPPLYEEIDFEKVGINVARAVILSIGERMNHMLIHAIEDAVAVEMEKLRDALK